MRIAKVTFDEAEALRLYKEGENDTEIATSTGTIWQSVTKWRNRNKLPSNLKRRKANGKGK